MSNGRPGEGDLEELKIAERSKAEGTAHFQAGRFEDAYLAWKRGLEALEVLPPEDLGSRGRRLTIALGNNAAQALLSCDFEGARTERARVMTQKVLALDPTNVKALYRRGCSYINAEKWSPAKADFCRILELEPANEAAGRELRRAEEAEAKAEAAGLAASSPARDTDSDPADIVRRALKEAERLRRQALAAADKCGCVELWCQRFSKVQVQALQWTQHLLSDPELLEDTAEVWGPIFKSMDSQQQEDFLSAYEFVQEVKAQFGEELLEMRRRYFEDDDNDNNNDDGKDDTTDDVGRNGDDTVDDIGSSFGLGGGGDERHGHGDRDQPKVEDKPIAASVGV